MVKEEGISVGEVREEGRSDGEVRRRVGGVGKPQKGKMVFC